MAQEAQTPEQSSIADGVTSSFPISFTFADSAEVRVLIYGADGAVDQVEGVDYTISGATILFQPGRVPASGARVARWRSTPPDQQEPFGDQATFRPLANEAAFDKLTRLAQEGRAGLDRALQAPIGEPGPTLQPQAIRDGGVAVFDGAQVGSFHVAPGEVLAGHPETGAPVSIPPIFAVDQTPASVASRLQGMFTTFPAPLLFVRTAGYDEPGDGGGGLYKRANAEPAHEGKFLSADGTWWELREWEPNVLQFGAKPSDNPAHSAINAAAFLGAAAYRWGITVGVPPGDYYCDGIPCLHAAGVSFRGIGRWAAKIKPGPTLTEQTDAIFYNPNAALGTSGYGFIENIGFELLGQDCTAINLDSCNNFEVRKCRAWGGTSLANAAGVLVRFDAIRNEGAYSNRVIDCDGLHLYAVVVWGEDANHNSVQGGEAIGCTKGYDVNPGGNRVDTARISDVRTEGCNIGVDDGAIQGFYLGVRSENNQLCDFRLTAQSDHPTIIPGYTAATATPILGLNLAVNGYDIQSDDLGWFSCEPSLSRVRRTAAKQAFYGPTQSLAGVNELSGDWAVFLGGTTVLRRNFALEVANATSTNTLIGLTANGNTLVLSGYDRANAGYGPIDIGGGASVRPITDNATTCGAPSRRWSEVFAGTAAINLSDRRAKTDIRELSEAELRVARRCRRLFKAYRLVEAVNRKGDDARIHIGVIVQDVIAEFEAEELDPFAYGMVCHDTWDAEPAIWSEPQQVEEQDVWEGGEPILYLGGEEYVDDEGRPQRRQRNEPVLDDAGHETFRAAGEPKFDHRGAPVMRLVPQPPVLLRPATEAGDAYSLRYEEFLCFTMAGLD